MSATLATRAEAVAFEAAWKAAIERGERPPDPPRAPEGPILRAGLRVIDVLREFGAGVNADTVRDRSGRLFKPSTSRRYESLARTWIAPRIGAVDVRDLTRGGVQAWVDEVAVDGSPETARKALVALRTALRGPLGRDEMQIDPCIGVRPPAPEAQREIRLMGDDERRRMIAALEADDELRRRSLAAPLAAVLFGAGLRLGEALALPWGAGGLDLDAGVVHVRRSLDRLRGRDGMYAFVDPKSRAGVRDVPLAASTIARLRRHRMAAGRRDGELVFAEDDGSPLGATGKPTHAWRRARMAADVEAPLPAIHDARHAWAVDALRAGLNYREVAKLGGWSSTKIVHERYGRHVAPDELVDVGARLEAAMQARRL